MTADAFVKAKLAELAWREAHMEGLNNMLAIAHVIRNRVRAGWLGGDWLQIIANVNVCSAKPPHFDVIAEVPDIRDPIFVRLLQLVDGIYEGTAPDKLTVSPQGRAGLYWATLHEQNREWFTEKIVRNPEEHPKTSQVGQVTFFG